MNNDKRQKATAQTMDAQDAIAGSSGENTRNLPKSNSSQNRKRNLSIAALVVVVLGVAFVLFGTHTICFHNWIDANCVEPKHCTNCGQTEGEKNPDAHSWVSATCAEAKHCTLCGLSIGEPNQNSHVWVDLDGGQTGAKYCKYCGKTVGSDNTPDDVEGNPSKLPQNENAATEKEGDPFSLSPEKFKERFESISGLSMSDTSNGELISYVSYLESNDTSPVMLSFSDKNGNTLGSNFKFDSFCTPCPILVVPTSSSEMCAYLVMACDPSVSYEDSNKLLLEMGQSGEGNSRAITQNGITYRLTGVNDSSVLFTAQPE